jgi:HAD superfamily hydrolase (TIGR01549 family)
MQRPRHAKPRALLIDGLGTLVSLRPPAPALVRELERRFGCVVSELDAERALAAEIAFYREHMGDGVDAESLHDLRRRCAEVLRNALGSQHRQALGDIDAVTEALLDSLRFVAYPDAREALVGARARGSRVVVVSNWDVSLIEVLEQTGLAPLLHGVATSAAVGSRKPDPAIFAHALALAGVSADRALHVGDNLEEDVEGARACGIDATLLRRDRGRGPARVPTISSLARLDWP